jgi:hypothetical protein
MAKRKKGKKNKQSSIQESVFDDLMQEEMLLEPEDSDDSDDPDESTPTTPTTPITPVTPKPSPVPQPALSPEPKANEPAPDSPRWNEIYGKLKQSERDLQAGKETILALQQHNKQLAESISNIEEKVTKSAPRPDPQDDPDKYDEWVMDQVMAKMNKAQTQAQAPAQVPGQPVQPVNPNQMPLPGNQQQQQPPINTQLAAQEAAMSALHEDYYDIIPEVMKDCAGNYLLRDEIFQNPNPARAAYTYGKKKRGEKAQTLDQGTVEPSAPAPSSSTTLTPEQERVRQGLGVSKESYIKQVEMIEKMKGGKR